MLVAHLLAVGADFEVHEDPRKEEGHRKHDDGRDDARERLLNEGLLLARADPEGVDKHVAHQHAEEHGKAPRARVV